MRYRFLPVLLAFVLAFGLLAGCSDDERSANTGTGDRLAGVRAAGEIVAATEGTWAPWTYHDERDTLTGFDVEVMRLVAGKLGVKARFVESEWDGIFAGLDAKRWDIAANGVEVTPERAAKYDFSTPYAYIHTALIVRADNDTIKTFEDLKGKRTANSLSSTYMELAESYGAEAVGVDSLGETLEMVLAGRVDATLNADVSFFDYMRAHPEANLKIVALTEHGMSVVFPVVKGQDAASFLAAVNQAITELRTSGELERLSQQFFGSDITAVNK